MRVDQVAQRVTGIVGGRGLLASAGLRPDAHRADVAAHQLGVDLEIVLGGLFDL